MASPDSWRRCYSALPSHQRSSKTHLSPSISSASQSALPDRRVTPSSQRCKVERHCSPNPKSDSKRDLSHKYRSLTPPIHPQSNTRPIDVPSSRLAASCSSRPLHSAAEREEDPMSDDTPPPSPGGVPFQAVFDFPNVPTVLRGTMEGLLRQVEGAIGGEILPSSTPAYVRRFQSPHGSQGFITVFPGKERAKVDRVLLSWLFCPLPAPGSPILAFSTLLVLMGPLSDAPHLLIELTFSGAMPSPGEDSPEGAPGELQLQKAVAVLDLILRKDPVAYPDYLQRVCQDSGLDALWQETRSHPLFKPYKAPTPYIRASLSPTAISVMASVPPSDTSTLELVNAVDPLALKVVQAWAENVEKGTLLTEAEAPGVKARDLGLAVYGFEADLTRNLPRIFGDEVTKKVVHALRNP